MPKVVLLTKHQKLASIAPVLTPLGFELEEFSNFDTDSLGTFSGEVERTLSPKECALHKAQKACELTGCDIGLGSEGSFGGGPLAGFVTWNIEILCFYQKPSNTAIYAFAEGPCELDNLDAKNLEELVSKTTKLQGQHWIYKDEKRIIKALDSQDIIRMIAAQELYFPLKLEPDLRAMFSPERRIMIHQAAQDLAQRLLSPCPACRRVDFVIKTTEKGLLCQLCGLPTNEIKFKIKRCDYCGHEEKLKPENKNADPGRCGYCNP